MIIVRHSDAGSNQFFFTTLPVQVAHSSDNGCCRSITTIAIEKQRLCK